jgi:hypothetical protein
MESFHHIARDGSTGAHTARLGGRNEALAAKLRGIFAKFSEALPPSYAKATESSPRLHPRSKLRGIRQRRIKTKKPDTAHREARLFAG